MINSCLKIFIGLLLFLPGVSAAHEEEVLFNRIYLQAGAEREIPNDQMEVWVYSEQQGKEPGELADRVNRDMAWALDMVKPYQEVKSSTRAYRTTPIYKDRTIVGWRVVQELALKSKAITRLTELTGRLQERLKVRQMQFTPTEETRTKNENELIEEALQAFHQRVGIVKKHMPGKDFRIVDLHVNTSDQYIPPVARMESAPMKVISSAKPPAVEAGTSRVTVTVSGSVQFF